MGEKIGLGFELTARDRASMVFNRMKKSAWGFQQSATTAANTATGSMGKFGQTLNGASQKTGRFSSSLKSLAGSLGLMAGAYLVISTLKKVFQWFKKIVRVAGEFENQLAEISTLLSKSDMAQMPKLERSLLNLSVATGKSTADLTKASYQAISAGIRIQDSSKFLETASKLAVGGVTDMTTAVDGLTSIKNAYGFSMKDMTKVSDQMFIAMRAGKTTIGELSRSIGQVAPIAANMKIGLGEVLAMTATITKGGLTTSEAITGVRQALISVLQATPRFVKQAEKLGIAYDLNTVRQMGFSKWLIYAKNQAEKQGGSIKDLFRRVQGLNAVLALTGKSQKEHIELLKTMRTETGTTADAYKKMAGTYKMIKSQADQAKAVYEKTMGKAFLKTAKNYQKLRKEIFMSMAGLKAEGVDAGGIMGFVDVGKFKALKGILNNELNELKSTSNSLMAGITESTKGYVDGMNGFLTVSTQSIATEFDIVGEKHAIWIANMIKQSESFGIGTDLMKAHLNSLKPVIVSVGKGLHQAVVKFRELQSGRGMGLGDKAYYERLMKAMNEDERRKKEDAKNQKEIDAKKKLAEKKARDLRNKRLAKLLMKGNKLKKDQLDVMKEDKVSTFEYEKDLLLNDIAIQ